MKPKKAVKQEFTVSFTIADKLYTGKGATILEALQAVPRPVKITGKAYIQVSDGVHHKGMPLTVDRAKRFFYPMAQVFVAKQLSLGLK